MFTIAFHIIFAYNTDFHAFEAQNLLIKTILREEWKEPIENNQLVQIKLYPFSSSSLLPTITYYLLSLSDGDTQTNRQKQTDKAKRANKLFWYTTNH